MFNLPHSTSLGLLTIVDTFEFYDVPRLFSVKNATGSIYLAVSIFDDEERYEWLYVETSIDRMNSIVNGRISLHSAYTTPENGFLFKILSDFDGKSQVEHLFPENLSEEELPLKGAFLNRKRAKSYGLGAIDHKIAAFSSGRETCNIHLHPWDTNLPELNSRSLGRILICTQELIDAIGQTCQEEATIKGSISAEVLNQTGLNACQIFEGSFGLQLKAEQNSDLLGDSLLANVFQEVMSLLSAKDDIDNLSNKLHLLKGRVSSKYRKFLKEINKLSSDITLDWGSPKPDCGGSAHLSKRQVENAYSIVDKIDIEMSEAIDIQATLIGLNIRTKRYEISSVRDDEKYSGRVSEEALGEVGHAVINNTYTATLTKMIETKATSGDETVKWVLISLKSN
jgi:hypothetical protein